MYIETQRIILEQALEYLNKYKVEDIKPILKGYSDDAKYLIKLIDGKSLLLKVSPMKDFKRKKQELIYLKLHYNNGVKCSQPLEFFILEEHDVCVSLLTFLEGKSGEEVLPLLSKEEQYSLGWKASEELRKIHKVEHIESFDWYKKRWDKYLKKKKIVKELGYTFYKQDVIEDYIEKNYEILKDSPVRFQHDDFQPLNMIFNGNELRGIIDFNRFDWGDPLEEFFKLPKYTNGISVEFSKGQVDGYFAGFVSDYFWRKYNLFVALNFHASIIGGHYLNTLDMVRERQRKIFDTHDFVNHGAPEWYIK
ncbi:aminoglycoside phosphotransferase family protein [Oceanirhabdus sp. W0125-5]|uniref:aminoglycoside phosphotransferase family protein n=1 Tax=Oceanirhabdus sp. W0125-5 TaxID=2999116 RepID=UPI0022F313AE|nr:aminoglycoside phosphotransferase family protein [Oceanirhabdus sp. W0125-5]WBW96959.1 aminoglycoside phosphotransferase family protein [Oceanirhabdus sp. W0125-5]